MARVKSKNTKPELTIRSYLHRRGYRYSLNSPRVLGKPDLLFRKYGALLFVNGCFWHGHTSCKKNIVPKTNSSYWQAKILRNAMRDRSHFATLIDDGWRVGVIWECALTSKRLDESAAKVIAFINGQDRFVEIGVDGDRLYQNRSLAKVKTVVQFFNDI